MLGTSINALGVSHDKSASQIGVAEHKWDSATTSGQRTLIYAPVNT